MLAASSLEPPKEGSVGVLPHPTGCTLSVLDPGCSQILAVGRGGKEEETYCVPESGLLRVWRRR